MRPLFALVLFGLSSLSSGCALFVDASRNFAVSLARPVERARERHRNYRWAEQAWAETCAADGAEPRSPDYAAGFKDGFAEYLFRGGNGEPPLVASLCYRGARYQTPQGYQAIQDWFTGYRHGASVAKKSGAREWITGPSSLRAATPGPAPPVAPAPPPEGQPDQTAKPRPQVLPPPHPIPDAMPPKKSAGPAPSEPVVEPPDAGMKLPPDEPTR
jgi:hypothetical protein